MPGPYTIRARDSILIYARTADTIGHAAIDRDLHQIVRRTATMAVEARVGHVTPIDLRMPWRDAVGGCTTAPGPELRFAVLGVVVTPSNEPIPNSRIQLRWADTVRGSMFETEMEGVTDDGGGFFLCGLPAEVPLSTRVSPQTGAAYQGTTKVSRVGANGGSGNRGGVFRTLRIVVAQPGTSKQP